MVRKEGANGYEGQLSPSSSQEDDFIWKCEISEWPRLAEVCALTGGELRAVDRK